MVFGRRKSPHFVLCAHTLALFCRNKAIKHEIFITIHKYVNVPGTLSVVVIVEVSSISGVVVGSGT